MAVSHPGRRKAHLISRGRCLALRPSRLGFETLEPRLTLSASSAYDAVSASWYGAPPVAPFMGPTLIAWPVSAVESAAHTVAPQSTEWIVRLSPQATTQAGGVAGAAAVLGNLGFGYQVARGLGLPGQLLLEIEGASDAQIEAALDGHAAIAYAGRNGVIQGAALSPNETSFQNGQLFGLNVTSTSGFGNPAPRDSDIDAPDAWDGGGVRTGSASTVVAVLDSGMDYAHEDLTANVWTDPATLQHGYDFYATDGAPLDENGHGTHVAGIIGARGNNGVGVTGVNWTTSLMSVRVLGPDARGDVADAIAGIAYVTGLSQGVNIVTGNPVTPINVRVINASWAIAGQSVDQANKTALYEAIRAAGNANILVVAAAGNGDILNNGVDLNNASFVPATVARDLAGELDNLIVVAASDPYDRITPFSNYGAGIVDLAAPGDDIFSTLPANQYGYRDGTSMAAPFVSGVAALVLANTPDLTPAEIKAAIVNTVDPLATPEDRVRVTSGGRLNAAGAVNYSAFAPRAVVQSASNITTSGAATHAVTIRYTGKTAINTATLGTNDIVVRRGADGPALVVQSASAPTLVGGNPNVVDVTYTIVGPGDNVWNALDNGVYRVEIVAESVSDTAGLGHPAQATEARTYASAFSVAITQGVFVVQRTDDSIDSNPGNGLPDYASPGTGFTLRGALQEANLVSGSVVIVRPGAYTLTRSGAGEDARLTGDLDITGTVAIAGDGADVVTINAAGLDRVFEVLPGGSLALSGATITGGSVPGDGGGIRNWGTLSVLSSTVEGNFATQGGGIYNGSSATATIGASSVLQNDTSADIPALDPSWGTAGAILQGFDRGIEEGRSIARQSDGKIVVAGRATNGVRDEIAVARYLTTGELDPTFGVGGRMTTSVAAPGLNNFARDVAIQSDGKIVVVGTFSTGARNEIFVVRLNADGALDGTFGGGDGKIAKLVGSNDDTARGVAIQADGKIVVAGASNTAGDWDFTLIRLLANGDADTSFSGDGVDRTSVTLEDALTDVAIQSDGKIVAGGYTGSGTGVDFALVRYLDNGTLDSSFSGDGKQTTNFAGAVDVIEAIALQADGKIVAVGSSVVGATDDMAVARYDTNGNLDNSFSGDGKLTTALGAGNENAQTVAIQSDGKIVVAGYSLIGATNDFAVLRYLTDGELDVTFSGDGVQLVAFGVTHDVALGSLIQPDGKIVVTGYGTNSNDATDRDFAVARLNASGALDNTFHNDGLTLSEFDSNDEEGRAIARQSDGKIVVVGRAHSGTNYDIAIARYLANGQLDSTFGFDGRLTTVVTAGRDHIVRDVAIQSDGKIVVVGSVFNGTKYQVFVVRLNANGVPDGTFDGDGKQTASIGTQDDLGNAVAIDASGKIVVAGSSKSGGNDTDFALFRFLTNGTLDASFNGDGIDRSSITMQDELTDVAIQSDGKIVAGGYSGAGAAANFALVRYLATGTLDTSFSGDGKQTTDFAATADVIEVIAIQPNGKIVVAGSSVDGVNADTALARYDGSGELDFTFSGDGKLTTALSPGGDSAYSVALQADGKIVIAGFALNGVTNDFALARFTANGQLDESFGGDGSPTVILGPGHDVAHGALILPDGKILAVGYSTVGSNRNLALVKVNNPSGAGGGVYNAGTMTISTTTIEGNTATANGGGIYTSGPTGGGSLAITGSTIANNAAIGDGGGIYNGNVTTETTIASSTIHANTVEARNVQVFDRVGVPVLVNASTALTQYQSRLAVNSSGELLATWINVISGSDQDVYARRLTSSGTPDGAEFYLGGAHPIFQQAPVPAIADDGAFAVGYQKHDASTLWDAYLLPYDVSGASGTTAFVNAVTAGQQTAPEPVVDSAGNYTVIFNEGSGLDGDGQGVYLRRFSSTGSALGAPVRVNQATAGNQANASAALFDNNEGIVVWSDSQADGSGLGIYARFINATGTPVNNQFRVNAEIIGNQTQPHVAASADGFVVSYRDVNRGVIVKRYSRTGVELDENEMVIAATTENCYSSVAMLPGGGFAIAWKTPQSPASSLFNLYVQAFDADGAAVAPARNLVTVWALNQGPPSIAATPSGDVWVLWDGAELAADREGIYVQKLSYAAETVGGNGGGMYNAGDLEISTSTISSNQAAVDGGGLYNADEFDAINVTISGNEAANQGGGIQNTSTGTSMLTNSTVTANQVTGAYVGNPPSPVSFSAFSFLATNTSDALAAGDFSGDGIADVIISDPGSNLLRLYRGNGNGIYQAPTAIGNVSSHFFLTVGDFNRDNVLDLAVPDAAAIGFVKILLGTGGGNFAPPVSYQTGAVDSSACDIIVADFDGDGNEDLAVNNIGVYSAPDYLNGSVKVLWGNGDGTFVSGPDYPLQPRMWSLAVGNIDADPQLELVALSVNRYQLSVVNYVGTRQFQVGPQIVVKPGAPDSFGDFNDHLMTDLNADGNLDLAVAASATDELLVMLGNGNGTFQAAAAYLTDDTPLTLNAADFNRDGRIDMAVTSYSGTVAIALNSGAGAFAMQPGTNVGSGSRNTSMHDLDGNGSLDIAVLGGSPNLSLNTLLNTSPGVPSGAVSNAPGGTVNLKNTVVAQNSSTRPSPDVVGTFVSQGGNLIGDVGLALGLVHGTNSNQVGSAAAAIDPKLGPLADNGGPTKTHMPAADSPAIDAGVAPGAPAVDQRGALRPADGDHNGSAVADIGAVEHYYATISGKKFNDRNGNGVEDLGEEGLPGWTIYLDADADGRLDANERRTVTDALGHYEFNSLVPGTHIVAEVLQPGWERTHVDSALVQSLLDDNAAGTADGLDGARAMAATADGRFVFVAGASEAEIGRFERNSTTGALAYLGATTTAQTVPAAGGVNVLFGVVQLAVSKLPVGGVTYLYALSSDGAIVVYSVNTSTGALTFSQVFREDDLPNPPTLAAPKQFAGSTGLAVSPDGTRVYVSNKSANTTTGGALFAFERSGASLLFRARRINSASVFGAGGHGVAVAPAVAPNHFIYVAGATADASDTISIFTRANAPTYLSYVGVVTNNTSVDGVFIHGLDGAHSVVLSPNADYLYVTAETDGAVTVFERNATTGALKFVQTLASGDVDYLGNEVRGLQQAGAIAMSADGTRVYVAGKEADLTDPENPIFAGVIAVFQRDATVGGPTSGRLSFLEEIIDGAPDGYGTPIENVDAVAAMVALNGQFLYAAGESEDALSVFRRDTLGVGGAVTLLDGEARTGVDFSNRALPGSIRGIVYNNLDGDLVTDVDEPTLAGWEVYLDLDNDGTWDSSPAEPIVETDATGTYAFENVPAGASYVVRLKERSGWAVTAPTFTTPPPTIHHYTVSIAPGEDELRKDFGVTLQNVGAGLGSFEGVVFLDVDGNGVQAGAGEPGLGNLRVYLDLDDDGVRDASEPTATTNNSTLFGVIGRYAFSGIPEAPFAIRIDSTDVGGNRRILAPLGNALVEQSYSLDPSINPTQVVAADFDDDDDADLAVLTLDGVVSIFRNNGSGSFAAPLRLPNALQATSLAVGDFNGDARPDIALASSTRSTVWIAMNQPVAPGLLAFSPSYNETAVPVTLSNWDIVAGNFDGDLGNKADLALAQRSLAVTSTSNILILHSASTLTPSFSLAETVPVGRQPRSLEVGQIDGTGGVDLAVINQYDRTVQVLLKEGGVFSPKAPIVLPTGTAVDTPFSLALGQFKSGAKADLVIGNSHTSAVTLLVSIANANYGPGGWTNVPLDASGLARDIVVADIDGDGDRDILVGTVGPSGITLLRNVGTPAAPLFAPPEVKGVGNLQTSDLPGVKSLVVGDFLGNAGLPDVAAVNGRTDAGSLLVLANSAVNGTHRAAAVGASAVTNLNYALQTVLVGDYNADLQVDGDDVLVWQRTLGPASKPAGLGADGNNNGVIDAADLGVWRGRFGQSLAAAAAQSATSAAGSGASGASGSAASSESLVASEAAAAIAADEVFAAGDFTGFFQQARAYRPPRRLRYRGIA